MVIFKEPIELPIGGPNRADKSVTFYSIDTVTAIAHHLPESTKSEIRVGGQSYYCFLTAEQVNDIIKAHTINLNDLLDN